MIAITRNIAQKSPLRAFVNCRAKLAAAAPTFALCSFFSTRHDTVGRFGKYSVDYEESISNKDTYWHRAASDLQ